MGGCPEIWVKTKQYELSLSLFHPDHQCLVTQKLFLGYVTTDANIFLRGYTNDPSVHVKIGYSGLESGLSPVKNANAAGHAKGQRMVRFQIDLHK